MIQTAPNECFKDVLDQIAQGKQPMFLPKAPWFAGIGERCVEVPWAISRYRGQKNILEIGLALADLTLIHAQLGLKKLINAKYHGVDIVDLNRVMNRFAQLDVDIRNVYEFTQADARRMPYLDNQFDLVFLISTLEHFGFDQFEPNKDAGTVFKRTNQLPRELPSYDSCKEDRKALQEIKRVLSKGGSLLLTLPMGARGICALQDSKGLWAFYKEYSLDEWNALIKDSGLTVVEQQFYADYGADGWLPIRHQDRLLESVGDIMYPTTCVGCVELRK